MNSAKNVNNSKMVSSTPRIQNFSLPSDVIYLMLKNPSSPFSLQKLYQTCKYFFAKRPILVFSKRLGYFDSFDKFCHSPSMRWYCNHLYIPRLSITNTLKLYRCTIHTLTLKETSISYDNFQVLVAENTVKSCCLKKANIFYSDENAVCIDGILECLPNITKFDYCNPRDQFKLKTLENLNFLKFWNKFENLEFKLRHDITHKELLCNFILTNSLPSTEISFGNSCWFFNDSDFLYPLEDYFNKVMENLKDHEKPKVRFPYRGPGGIQENTKKVISYFAIVGATQNNSICL